MRLLPGLACVPTCVLASTFYVAPHGNNAWPGTLAQPWASPGYGSKHMSGGDTLVILSGDYVMSVYDDDMITPPSGSAQRWTLVVGSGPTRPRMLGRGSLYSCVAITGSFIAVKNLVLTSLLDTPYTGGARQGVDAGPVVHHLLFEDLEIFHVEEMGFNLGGDAREVTIRRCRIHHNGYTALGGPPASGQGWVQVLVDSCSLSYSGHFYLGQEQPSPYDRPDGLGFEDSQGPVEVRYTVAEHNRGDGLDSKARNTHVHHCVVANNWADGVKLWGAGSRVENTLIYGTGDADPQSSPWCLLVVDSGDAHGQFSLTNVTMWDSPARAPHYVATVQYDRPQVPITLVMRNVIVSGRRQFWIAPSSRADISHCTFFIEAEEQVYAQGTSYTASTLPSLGPANEYADPQFVAPAWGLPGDFHLRQGSPAIDTGCDTGLPDDLDGFPRPYHGLYDRGCYEFHPSSGDCPIGRPPGVRVLSVSPNPASHSAVVRVVPTGCARRLSLFDLAGRLVWEVEVDDPARIPLDLANLRPGSYVIHAEGVDARPVCLVVR